MQSGVLALDKPEGPSSARVVQKVKIILAARKVGHLGTLDPLASGLLPMGVNEGTKIAALFLEAQKSYTGVITLGMETDSQDSTGKVIGRRSVPNLSAETLRQVERAFSGMLRQTPPMYSALKRDGMRLYELARRGEWVPRPVREIRVQRLQLWPVSETDLKFEIVCSKGTYIRTLAAEMGEFLGCGAHLKSLRRLSCGSLILEQAVTLEELKRLKEKNQVPLISLNDALSHLPEFKLDVEGIGLLRMGRQEVLAQFPPPQGNETVARITDGKGNLIALVHGISEGKQLAWRLSRVLSSPMQEQQNGIR